MKRTTLFLMMILLIAGITSCKKEDKPYSVNEAGNPTTNPSGEDLTSGNTITASVSGIILNESNSPVSGATVYLGSYSTTTNAYGAFLFENVKIDDKHCFVRTDVSGYFPGSRSFDPSSGDMHNLRIKLLPMTNVGSVSSTSGGTVNVPGGAQLIFEPGDIALESGGAYSGGVHVSAVYLNPLADDLAETMPGDLLGIDASNQEVVLESYGMIAVELFGDAGEALNVKAGESVEIKMPIHSEQASSAPTSIPLWYFDEINGNWVEDGVATASGGMYGGTVTHFSFWNCDMPYPGMYLKVHFTAEGEDVAGIKVSVWEVGDTWATGYSITDADGIINEPVPLGPDLILKVQDDCGEVIYEQAIGVISTPTDLGTIELPDETYYVNLTGTVTDCALSPTSDGAVAMVVGASSWPYIFYTDASGNIDETILVCDPDDITVYAYNFETFTEADPEIFSYSTSIDFGSIAACEDLSEFIDFNLDGDDYIIFDASLVMAIDSVGVFRVGGYDISTSTYFQLGGIPSTVGTHALSLQVDDSWLNANFFAATSGSITANVDEYPGMTEGTFSGSFVSWGETHTISGSWRADLE